MEEFLRSLPTKDETNFSTYSTPSRAASRTQPKRPTVYIKTYDPNEDPKPEGVPIRNEKTSILLRYMQQQQKQQEKEKDAEVSKRKRRSPGKSTARRGERRKVPRLVRVDDARTEADGETS
ncbi:DET1- and DDB1-associated protein 1-like [Corticium candelabrum]|uniref:DET1- and DDB1-associated protein 1-like n=1 Tax=Corticium candelabrum TaxID=121492 RepID=UPI002E270DC6|nr:DET1- and DDB1-associated protein 1-like [Corticium candelabrum]